jgi:hypothetical protein
MPTKVVCAVVREEDTVPEEEEGYQGVEREARAPQGVEREARIVSHCAELAVAEFPAGTVASELGMFLP